MSPPASADPSGPFAELTEPTGPFDDLTGQDAVIAQLRRASAAAGAVLAGERPDPGAMTHAWLFTGPPGSGRSVAARGVAPAVG
jgi:DNA polymerase III subunit delta'